MTHRAPPVPPDANLERAVVRHPSVWWPLGISLTALAVGAAVLALAASAEAQVPQSRPYCDEPAKAIAALKATFGEVPAAIGVDTQDRLVSLFVDPDDGLWTLLMTVPGKHPVSCVLSAGESWETAKPKPQGAPA